MLLSSLYPCTPITQEQQANLKREILDYEKSQKFRGKIGEVQKRVKVAAHHKAIDLYLRSRVLQPRWRSILELGCAAGKMLHMVQEAYQKEPRLMAGKQGGPSSMVGVELVTGWVKFAQSYFTANLANNTPPIQVYEGDVTNFSVPESSVTKTFDFVMLNDVAEHIQRERYGCFFQTLRDLTHHGSVVYMHTPNPATQLMDKEQYYENVLPHDYLIVGMAQLAGFELVQFEQDVDTNCGGGLVDGEVQLPLAAEESKCRMGGWPKYYHCVFRREDHSKVFQLS